MFPARNSQLYRFTPYSTDGFENETRFAYRDLSPNLVGLNIYETQLGSISIAIIPIFDNLGEFTVSVIDEETETEINTDLYSVSLDNIWVKIAFDSSLSSDTMYQVIITDDIGIIIDDTYKYRYRTFTSEVKITP